MLPDLLGEEGVGDELDEVVDGVDAWVDGLEALDLLPDGQGVGHIGREVALVVGHDEASQSLLIPLITSPAQASVCQDSGVCPPLDESLKDPLKS